MSSERARAVAWRILLGACCVLAGVAGDRWWRGSVASSASTPVAVDHCVSTAGEQARRPVAKRVIERPFLVRPVELFTATDALAEQRYRQQQARELLDLLRANVAIASKFYRGSAEGAVNQVAPYMDGWIQAVERTAPDLVDELALDLEKTFCDSAASEAQLVLMSRLLGKLPELASERAFECLFSQHPEEGPVLWSALDAFHLSGMAPLPALAQVAATARDERTLSRLHAPVTDDEPTAALGPAEDDPSTVHSAQSLSDILK